MTRRLASGEVWRKRGGWSPLAVAILAAALGLGGCTSGSASATSTPTATLPSAQATATTPGGSSTTSATPTSAGIAGSGSLDICQPVTPTPIQISVPPEIPVYSGSQIKLAEANNSGVSEFGFCIAGSVNSVAAYYQQALPSKGWTNLQTYTNLGTVNITAGRASEAVTITISPDTLQRGNTDLLIILQAQ
ncbi:MAG TPA: hypothetical protein VF808_02675 [Ktedonobacterales bacterium]